MRYFAAIIIALIITAQAFAADTQPQRIVSLAPNVTETLYTLGLGHRIVGVTELCDYPEEAKMKPKIGGMTNPSLEAIVALRPDLVVMTTDGNPREIETRLQKLGIKTFVFTARTLSTLASDIRLFGSAAKEEKKAEDTAKDIEERLKKIRVNTNAVNGRKKAVFIIWPEPLVIAGPSTELDEAITLLGYENMAKDSPVNYPRYSAEELLLKNPDIIFLGTNMGSSSDSMKRLLAKLRTTKAVKDNAVYTAPESLLRLTPRAIKGIEELKAIISEKSK